MKIVITPPMATTTTTTTRPKRVISRSAKERTRAATVWLRRKGGQGVLVPGGFVLTAAHCVDFYTSGGMALGDYCLEPVKTKTGATFPMSVIAVEPVADIAVLGAVDEQEFSDAADAFEEFCESTIPVDVCADDFATRIPVRVHVLTHHDTWIAGTATRYSPPARPTASPGALVWVRSKGNIEGGTSGGPVIDDTGRLVGVVSHTMGTGGDSREGQMPRPHLALPRWLWLRIEAATKDRERTAS
jgi:CBS domain-containing protein